MTFSKYIYSLVILNLFLASCSPSKSKKEVALFKTHCASCHVAPKIEHLTKALWSKEILPEMAARMGIRDTTYNPFSGLSFKEQHAINQTNTYPLRPIISNEDWQLLKNYIIDNAPDSLISTEKKYDTFELTQFTSESISLDSKKGSFITFLEYNNKIKKLFIGDMFGSISQFNFSNKKHTQIEQFNNAVVAYSKRSTKNYATTIGNLNPSEIASGRIFSTTEKNIKTIPLVLHRPVHSLVTDLNKNGNDEIIVSEFGHLTGKLSLLTQTDSLNYKKTILLNQPGTIRVLSKDMNNDGKEDLIALTSQGDESITMLYQEDNLQFRAEKVIRFSPIYGSSWFELVDFNGDGFDDIITANGDNADKTYIPKPYHGVRIHINDGKNNFEEKFFYALNGATRLIARDFDKDNDIDLAIISTFPDYTNAPELSFIYLENTDTKMYNFKSHTLKNPQLGRWFLMDAGDVDNDGDDDIILSSFTYVFTPVPDELSKLWETKNVDILLLKNNLN